MRTMKIPLPETLKLFVDGQVEKRSYGSRSEYIRELIRKEQDAKQLCMMLAKGSQSPVVGLMDDEWFDSLRRRERGGCTT